MLRLLNITLRHAINVYEGISPSLLATMSLSVNIKGNTHQELIQNLLSSNLISSKQQESAWRAVDRKYFTKAQNPYLNKPYPISKGQCMTDIFTHAVIINTLSPHWKNSLRILDIGTGHGYLSFLISKILQAKQYSNHSIEAIDINEESISFSKKLQQSHFNSKGTINFQCIDLEQYLKSQQKKFDIIIGGYYLEENISQLLTEQLNKEGVGIWPTTSQQGQALYKVQPNSQKAYIMETLFSMPVVRSSVQRYFIGPGEQEEIREIPDKETKNTDALQQKARIRVQQEKQLRNQLKALLEKNRKPDGSIPTLQQMRQNSQIQQKLQQLGKLSKTKTKNIPK